MRSSFSLVLVILILGAGSLAQAQDAPLLPAPRDPSPAEVLPTTEENAQAVPPREEDPEVEEEETEDEEEERRIPIVPVPARPAPADEGLDDEEELEEGTPIDEGFELPAIPDDPPVFRLRAGAGVSLPTAGLTTPGARFTQDFEVHLAELAPFYFGVGGAEIVNSAFIGGQAGVNVGLAAWIAQDPNFRAQGAIHFHIGAAFGGGNLGFDLGGEVDLRLLVADDYLEFHARGGFFTLGGVPSLSITGGIGVAF